MNKQQKLENNGVKFKLVNFNEVQMILPNINYEVVPDESSPGYAKSIIYEAESIGVGDRVVCMSDNPNLTQFRYKVNTIGTRFGTRSVSLLEAVCNKTTMFVIPLLFDSKTEASYIKDNTGYLINAYVDCDFIEKKDKYSVFLLLKYTTSDRFKLQEEAFLKNKNYIRHNDSHANYVIYEFSIPQKLRGDFDKLLNGKYSKISKFAIRKIMSFYKNDPDGKIVHSIITKDPDMVKDIENKLDVDMSKFEIYGHFDYKDVLTKSLL